MQNAKQPKIPIPILTQIPQKSLLAKTEQLWHFRAPPYPPHPLLVCLMVFNIALCFLSHNFMLYRMFCYIYGTLLLYRLYNCYRYVSVTVFVNVVVFWRYLSERDLTGFEEAMVFWGFCAIYANVLIKATIGVVRAVFLFYKPVQFMDMFWTVQLGLFIQYLNYFTGFRILRFAPSLLRVIQSLRGNDRSSMMSALRYSVHFIRQIFPPYTIGWIVVSIFVSSWQVYNNYWNQFGIYRIYQKKGALFLYPKKIIWYANIVVGVAQWSWIIPGRHVTVLSMVRRFLWNFMRVQYQASQLYKKYIILSILDIDSHSINNVIF